MYRYDVKGKAVKLLFLSLFIIAVSCTKDEDSGNKPTATTVPPPPLPCFNIKDGHPHGRVLISYSKAAHCPTQHVTILQNIKVIGPNAFKNIGLKEVFIPSTVTRIEDGAFDSNHLKRVILPDSVSHIGKNAFSNNRLLRINILMNVKSIRPKAFSGNPLSDGICIEFPSHHPSYKRISKNAFPDHVRARMGFICQTETGDNVSGGRIFNQEGRFLF